MIIFRRTVGKLMGFQHPVFFGWRELPVDNISETLGKFKCATRRPKKSFPGLGRLFGISKQVCQWAGRILCRVVATQHAIVYEKDSQD
jgi:hypothetical protein